MFFKIYETFFKEKLLRANLNAHTCSMLVQTRFLKRILLKVQSTGFVNFLYVAFNEILSIDNTKGTYIAVKQLCSFLILFKEAHSHSLCNVM